MDGKSNFITFVGNEVYQLSYGDMTAYVSLKEGMTIFQLEYKGRVVVAYNEERHEKGMTHGIPLLYPTPNRSRDNRFHFEGNDYEANAHGFLRQVEFQLVEDYIDDNCAYITGKYSLDSCKKEYDNYPFESIFYVTIELSNSGLCIRYKVKNQSSKTMPYGLGFHPFFTNERMDAKVKVFAHDLMEMGEDKIPSGRLKSVKDTVYDLGELQEVKHLSLDHVYTTMDSEIDSIIEYEDMRIQLTSSSEFGHMVVFTPEKPFFCIENQTCSTDAINLYTNGYKKASGLIVLEAEEEIEGYINYDFIDKVICI